MSGRTLIHLIFGHYQKYFARHAAFFINTMPYHGPSRPDDVFMSCQSANKDKGLPECPQMDSISRRKRLSEEGMSAKQALNTVVLADVFVSIQDK